MEPPCYIPSEMLITCEHGGNQIPTAYSGYFTDCEALLNSHRGYDPGALLMARELAKAFKAPLVYSTTSRLLIDLNRSLGHPKLYSEAIRHTPAAVRQHILERYYLPFRTQVEEHIINHPDAHKIEIESKESQHESIAPLFHLSSHSFTPELDGEIRQADVGLLYDPGRPGEAVLCARWLAALKQLDPRVRVRRNYPYTGTSDGFTAYLRRRFSPERYIGIELEINQKIVFEGGKNWKYLRSLLIAGLHKALHP